jgi:hypothetical protein
VTAVDAGVQLVKLIVKVTVADSPATPSKVAGVVAGDDDLFPDPEQVPEIAKFLA